jgi:hypothetical protein
MEVHKFNVQLKNAKWNIRILSLMLFMYNMKQATSRTSAYCLVNTDFLLGLLFNQKMEAMCSSKNVS